jgi:hypothetical protein
MTGGAKGITANFVPQRRKLLTMPKLHIAFHDDGWLRFGVRRLRPDFTSGQIHRWRIRLGPLEIKSWRTLTTPDAI